MYYCSAQSYNVTIKQVTTVQNHQNNCYLQNFAFYQLLFITFSHVFYLVFTKRETTLYICSSKLICALVKHQICAVKMSTLSTEGSFQFHVQRNTTFTLARFKPLVLSCSTNIFVAAEGYCSLAEGLRFDRGQYDSFSRSSRPYGMHCRPASDLNRRSAFSGVI